MPGPVIYVDTSDIRDGRLDDVREGISRLAAVVEREEPRILSYAAFLDEDEGRMFVVHVHADPESLAFHLEIGGPLFAAFADLVRLRTIDVYGTVGAEVRAALDAKARLLGSAEVRTHPLHAGFVRPPAAA